MSRTVRRVGKACDPKDELSWVTKDSYCAVYRPSGWLVGFIDLPVEFLEGKEYKKGWWKYHSDHHRNYWSGKKLYRKDWGAVRTANRKNLKQWFADEDKEIFFWEDVNTQEWD